MQRDEALAMSKFMKGLMVGYLKGAAAVAASSMVAYIESSGSSAEQPIEQAMRAAKDHVERLTADLDAIDAAIAKWEAEPIVAGPPAALKVVVDNSGARAPEWGDLPGGEAA